jgi:hypothetical protein
MTELLNAARPQHAADTAGQSMRPTRSTVPVLSWAIDDRTGRPFARWVLADKQTLPRALAPAPSAVDWQSIARGHPRPA